MRAILVLVISAALAGCELLATAVPQRIGPPQERLYVPQYSNYSFTLDNKYHISHEYFTAQDGGPWGCSYHYPDGKTVGDVFEKDGHVFQMGRSNREPKPVAYSIDRWVLGTRTISPLTGTYNPQTKKVEGGKTHVDFKSFCADRVGSHTYNVSLRKSSAETIDEGIHHLMWLFQNVWKELVRWEAPIEVWRGENRWIVFKFWNRAMYLYDAAEEWYLPIGDGAYYYNVSFAYKSSDLVENPVDYAKARAMFDRIIDSFQIEQIAPAASAK